MLATLKDLIPDHARDIKLNLSGLGRQSALNEQQLFGTLLACAIATRNRRLIDAAEAEVADKLSAGAVNAARAAASIMAMNNIYYRFVHLVSNREYGKIPARLRMNVIGNPGIDKADFELYSLAVSAINGCGLCIDSHEKVLLDHGIAVAAIQDAVRIAAVIHGVAVALESQVPAAA